MPFALEWYWFINKTSKAFIVLRSSWAKNIIPQKRFERGDESA